MGLPFQRPTWICSLPFQRLHLDMLPAFLWPSFLHCKTQSLTNSPSITGTSTPSIFSSDGSWAAALYRTVTCSPQSSCSEKLLYLQPGSSPPSRAFPLMVLGLILFSGLFPSGLCSLTLPRLTISQGLLHSRCRDHLAVSEDIAPPYGDKTLSASLRGCSPHGTGTLSPSLRGCSLHSAGTLSASLRDSAPSRCRDPLAISEGLCSLTALPSPPPSAIPAALLGREESPGER